jgi:hypothetical protein
MPPRASRAKKKDTEEDQDDNLKDVFDGELKKRRYGIRIDDDVEITVIAGNDILKVNGRLLSMKDEIELVDDEGKYIQIMADWVVAVRVIRHNRPLPEKDKELIKRPAKSKPKKASVDHAYN